MISERLTSFGLDIPTRAEKNHNVGGDVLPEAGTNTSLQEHEINVSYRHVFSPRLLNQLHFLIGHFDSPTRSTNQNPRVIVPDAFTGGGAQGDGKRTESHFDGTDIATYVSGKQELKFGVDVPDISRRGIDNFSNFAGTYYFASLADYAARRPQFYYTQRGQGRVTFWEKVVAGFIEDNIRFRPNLSISLGLRYYFQNYFHDDPDNFAPRFGFAYAPTEKSKTVIRGGAGVFYDRTGPGPIAELLSFNGSRLRRFIVQNPTFPVDPGSLSLQPASVVILDPRSRIPYTTQYGIGLERQLSAKSTLSVNFVGARGVNLFRSRDLNAPASPFFSARPNPGAGQIRRIESEGYQKRSALEVTFRGKATRFFTGQAQYTLGKTYNNTNGISYFPANSYSPSADWARADGDGRHKFDLLGSVQARKLFTVGIALALYSGRPINITPGNDDNRDGVTNDRPAGVPRNSLHGPGYANLDLSVARDFHLIKTGKEGGPTLSISLNAFNILNTRNDSTYVGTLSSPFFGRAIAAHPPRRMQINAEFKF